MDHHHRHQWLAATSSSSTARIEPLDQQQSSNNIGVIEREHMFDKVVTPSDVGKLNRLVIPKQYAEKYFPLNNNNNSSSEINGLLLNFEDSTGKSWRFRYSYWNSSQSYVMTKGWSRFVKDKKLDAGDIVSFQRGVGELQGDKLFIDFRRRPDLGPTSLMLPYYHHHHQYRPPSAWNSLGGGGGNNQGFMLRSVSQYQETRGNLWDHQYYHRTIPAQFPPIIVQSHPVYHNTRPMIFLRPPSVAREGGGGPPVVQGKRLRLFGVNMDFPINNNNMLNNQSGHHFDDSSSATSSTIQVLTTTTNDNNNDNSSSDPPHHSLQLRLCSNSDHFQLGKGKSSSPPSMSLDFDI